MIGSGGGIFRRSELTAACLENFFGNFHNLAPAPVHLHNFLDKILQFAR
jgi:hypothetical protein